MVRIVIFDFDGTIADTLPLCITAFKRAIDAHAPSPVSIEQITATFGANEVWTIKQLAGSSWQKALDDYYLLYEQLHDMCPVPFVGAIELIESLKKRGCLVALVTGKGSVSCDISLQKYGISELFDAVETGSPLYNRKAEAIESLLAKYSLATNEAVYIGDVVSDVIQCNKVGVKCLSATWADDSLSSELAQINKGNIVSSIEELGTRLDSLLGY